jgi:hypothetical protein
MDWLSEALIQIAIAIACIAGIFAAVVIVCWLAIKLAPILLPLSQWLTQVLR